MCEKPHHAARSATRAVRGLRLISRAEPDLAMQQHQRASRAEHEIGRRRLRALGADTASGSDPIP
eukprot:5233986-Pyramimonas_sp.AAC.1